MNYICNLCPRKCNALRNDETGNGYCMMPSLPVVSKASVHYWEEPCISGTEGSGTVFFTGCNMKCIFCQNYKISTENFGEKITIQRLYEIFCELQVRGVNNINLVSPTHFALPIIEALKLYKKSTDSLPVVYNCGGYENVDTLRKFEGLVDIYLPDIKYFDEETSVNYSNAPNYFDIATTAVEEMYRQVGKPQFNDNGIMLKGVIVRHLILPRKTAQAIKIISYLNEKYSDSILISVMSQYTPFGKINENKDLSRRINRLEYKKVTDFMYEKNITNGYIQSMLSADEKFIPDFDLSGI